jgi:hypothetical protein
MFRLWSPGLTPYVLAEVSDFSEEHAAFILRTEVCRVGNSVGYVARLQGSWSVTLTGTAKEVGVQSGTLGAVGRKMALFGTTVKFSAEKESGHFSQSLCSSSDGKTILWPRKGCHISVPFTAHDKSDIVTLTWTILPSVPVVFNQTCCHTFCHGSE